MGEFEWKACADGCVLTRYTGSAARAAVPEEVCGLAVREIGSYCFHGHRELERVTLPAGVKRLGAHCFYDCRNLRELAVSDGIRETADGCFKNCRSLHALDLTVREHHFTILKQLLDEVSRRVAVTIHFPDGACAKLLFPRFLQDYEENTAARIINQVTYGAGVHYRSCIGEHAIDYESYDGRFGLLVNLEEPEVCGEAALLRLSAPVRLSEKAAAEYEAYLHENLRELAGAFLAGERYELIELLADLASEAERDILLTCAQEAGALAVVSSLLQRRAGQAAEDEFDL
ncbi:MAG: leucine-rich repeat protein [Lachnospiraceae bacterium]|nr:leucine-rich repeat protein [Lachnospiraceae bacterium]